MAAPMNKSVSLNMIVKNEAKVIRRCLESVRPFIDTWVIVDTGSTDGTQDIIRDYFKDIPGELFERPWKDFGHNRTEAIRLAEGRADYLLLCDADMKLIVHDNAWKEKLEADAYLVSQRHNELSYRNIRLVNARMTGDSRWRYWGSTHEYIDCLKPDTPFCKTITDLIEFQDHADGGSKSEKYTRDAALLEREIKSIYALEREVAKNPKRDDLHEKLAELSVLKPRSVFYLAQTYRDLGEDKKSLEMYQLRATMGGWAEEVWYSLFEVAKLSERLKLDASLVIQRYLDAYEARPQRAEPLVQLARFYREQEKYALAHLFSSKAKTIPRPDDTLFIDVATYEWRALDEYAVASYWVGNYRECAEACETLLKNSAVPMNQLARITENLNFALKKMGKLS